MTQDITRKSSLFRENAINSINSPEEIQRCLKVIGPNSWIGISIFLSILIAMLIWGVYGQVTMIVIGNGIILPAKQLLKTEKYLQERISNYQDRLTLLKNLLDQKEILFKNHYLTTADFEKAQDEYLAAKENLTNLTSDMHIDFDETALNSDSNDSNQNLLALVFVNHSEGKKILPNMEAYILPSTLSVYDYGYIKGRVLSVSEYPVSKEILYSYLGNKSLVEDFFIRGTPFMVKIKLSKDIEARNQYSWTSKKNTKIKIEPGTKVDVRIIYKKSTPLQLLVLR